jgi:hypothetical protein
MDELRRHLASVEDVTTMDDAVHSTSTGGVESSLEVTKEVLSSSSSMDSRPKGVIEAQVSIGQEQDVD